MFIFKTDTCLSNPFNIASTTLSRYIIGIRGARILMNLVTLVEWYINRLSCGANIKSITDIASEKIIVYFIIFLVILFIRENSDLVVNSVISGISKLLKARIIVFGNKINGIAIPDISP